ncbi:MAG: prepilin peptidase [Gemmatimonadales bacterium]|nr:prepilin peptidase [Gemmatimonadales bacterium]
MADVVVLTIAMAGALGLLIGSFLNVCIVRWPAMESVVSPRSRCPQCGTLIGWYDNIPVISWLMLRGKCRQCALPIPIRYPLVELGVGVLWAAAAWQYGISLEALRAAVFLTILLGIAMTDAREFIIPDEFSIGGTVIGIGLAFAGGALGVRDAVVGAVVGYVVLATVGFLGRKAFGREAMGGGDIKMMAMVGAFTGAWGVLLTLMFGAIVGLLLHVAALPFRKTAPVRADATPDADVEEMSAEELRAQGYLPFGVSLAIAAAVVFVVGAERVIDWYLAMVL